MDQGNEIAEKIRKSAFAWSVVNREMRNGKPYSNTNYWFQKDILEDKSKTVVVKKSAQLGMSELMIMFSFWFMETRAENVLYCLPLDTNAKNFSKLKIDDIIDQMPHFGHKITSEAGEMGRRKKDSVNIKQLGDSSLIILGMNGSRTTLESFSAGLLMIDEYSKVTDPQMVSVAEKRLKASKNKLKRYFSTPLFPKDLTDKKFIEGKQFKWHISCDECGLLQNPNFFSHHNKFKHGDIKDLPSHYVCEGCNAKLDTLKRGKFIAMNPNGKYNSYHINTVFIPYVVYNEETDQDEIIDSAEDIYEKYLEALDDPNQMAEFYRQELGEGYLSANDGISEAELYDCQDIGRKIYSSEFQPVDGIDYVIGVDVGTKLHVVTIAVDANKNIGELVNFMAIEGFDKFDRLDEYIKTVAPTAGVIDMYPETTESERICNNNEKYSFKMAQHNLGLSTSSMLKKDENIILYNRTMSFDLAFQKIKNRRRKLPQDIDKEFIEHFTNVIRIEDSKKGKYIYTGKSGSKMPDHYLSAFVFAEMAVSMISSSKKKIDGRIVQLPS